MTPSVRRVLAPNPGPFTLEGTNTWVIGEDPAVVIDPGPDKPGHILAVLDEAEPVGAILLTHKHPDHAPGAARLASSSGAPVYAFKAEGAGWLHFGFTPFTGLDPGLEAATASRWFAWLVRQLGARGASIPGFLHVFRVSNAL